MTEDNHCINIIPSVERTEDGYYAITIRITGVPRDIIQSLVNALSDPVAVALRETLEQSDIALVREEFERRVSRIDGEH